MSSEDIQKRMADLERAMQQCLANYNMLQGGIEECKYWLKKLEELEN